MRSPPPPLFRPSPQAERRRRCTRRAARSSLAGRGPAWSQKKDSDGNRLDLEFDRSLVCNLDAAGINMPGLCRCAGGAGAAGGLRWRGPDSTLHARWIAGAGGGGGATETGWPRWVSFTLTASPGHLAGSP